MLAATADDAPLASTRSKHLRSNSRTAKVRDKGYQQINMSIGIRHNMNCKSQLFINFISKIPFLTKQLHIDLFDKFLKQQFLTFFLDIHFNR